MEEDWLGVQGATMYWSHRDTATYRRWLIDFGFEILKEQLLPEGTGGHSLFWAQLSGSGASHDPQPHTLVGRVASEVRD